MRINLVAPGIVPAIVFALVVWPAPPLSAEEWMLMGREGGCATLAQAATRRPLLRGVTTPEELVAKLRQEGEEVRRQDIKEGEVTVVQVEAPGVDLGLIFVPSSLCRAATE